MSEQFTIKLTTEQRIKLHKARGEMVSRLRLYNDICTITNDPRYEGKSAILDCKETKQRIILSKQDGEWELVKGPDLDLIQFIEKTKADVIEVLIMCDHMLYTHKYDNKTAAEMMLKNVSYYDRLE